MGAIYRVVVVDDDADLRALLRRRLERSGRFAVVAEAADGDEAVTAATTHQPHLTLLDLNMPGRDGLSALPLIRAAAPLSTVVVVSSIERAEAEERALAAGASGFIAKHHVRDDLVSDLLRVLEAVDIRPPSRQQSLDLPAELTSGGRARVWLRRTLVDWGLGDLVDDAQLLTSELVNNAVLHATSPVNLRLRLLEGQLRVEVTDTGGGALARPPTTLDDTSGRGLFMVEALSSAWGTSADDRGKVVWFELDTVTP